MNTIHAVLLGALFVVPFGQAQVPSLIHFQGRVTVNGTPFSGTGQFKLALVNGTVTTAQMANRAATQMKLNPESYLLDQRAVSRCRRF